MEYVDERGVRWIGTGEPALRGGEATVVFAVGPGGERAAVKLGDAADARFVHAEHDLLAELGRDPDLAGCVVRARGRGWSSGRPFAVYGRLDAPLDGWIRTARAAPVRRRVAAAACDAVARLHGHRPALVHGDLKPANLFLDGDGVRIGDFGAAKPWRPGTTTTLVLFSHGWSAPEVAAGHRPDPGSDLYALAATVFAILVGAPPRSAGANAAAAHLGRDDGDALRPEDRAALIAATGDPALVRALADALAPSPARRRGTAAELAARLARPPEREPLPWRALAAVAVGVLGLAPAPLAPTPAVRLATADGAFLADPWLVTQGGWREVLGEDLGLRREFDGTALGARCDAWRRRGTRSREPVSVLGDALPAHCVDLRDAVRYANARSRRDGLEPAYRWVDGRPERIPGAPGWRLPSPGEWRVLAAPALAAAPADRCAGGNLADRRLADAVDGKVTPAPCDDGWVAASPVGALAPTADGIHDAIGDVRVWAWPDARTDGLAPVLGASWAIAEPLEVDLDERLRALTLGLRVVRDAPAGG